MPYTIGPYGRLLVQCFWTCIALLLTCDPIHAALCLPPNVQKESAYHYMLSFTDALSYAKSAVERIPGETESQSSSYDLLLGFRLGKKDYECAESQVSPYIKSSNEAIQASSEMASMAFARLADLQDESAAQYKSFLDSIGEGNLKPGTMLDERAKLGASYDETWKILPMAATAGTYAVVEEDPATGRMSGLALTAKQRDEILQKLRSTFGNEITQGVKAGQISLVAAAAVLYEVIGNQPRKTRDSK